MQQSNQVLRDWITGTSTVLQSGGYKEMSSIFVD